MARSNSPANTDAMSSEPVSINCSINDSIAVSCGCRILVLLGCYRENQNDGPPHRGAYPSVGHKSVSSKRISRRHVTQPRGGRVHSHHVPNVTAKNLRPIVEAQIHGATFVMTDEG